MHEARRLSVFGARHDPRVTDDGGSHRVALRALAIVQEAIAAVENRL